MKNRKGVVIIRKDTIYDNLNILPKMFAHFVPTHMQTDEFHNKLIYYGHSELFDEIIEGEVFPTYMAEFKKVDGIIEFSKFDRLD